MIITNRGFCRPGTQCNIIIWRYLIMKFGKIGLFVAGFLFGTAGVKLLSSKDAKKVYVHTTAAALRAKESIMTTVTNIRENAGDIVAEAKDLNEKRALAEETVVEDTSETVEVPSDEKAE